LFLVVIFFVSVYILGVGYFFFLYICMHENKENLAYLYACLLFYMRAQKNKINNKK